MLVQPLNGCQKYAQMYRARIPGVPADDGEAALQLLKEALLSVPEELRQGIDAELGVNYQGPSKEHRYTMSVGISRSTCQRHFKLALEDFAKAVMRLSGSEPIASGSRLSSSKSLGYEVEAESIYYRLTHNKLIKGAQVKVSVRPIEPTSRIIYRAHFRYFTDRPEHIEISPEFGCERLNSWTENGVRHVNLGSVGKVVGSRLYHFLFSVKCDSQEPMDSRLMVTPDTDIASSILGVEFGGEETTPTQIWRFDGLSYGLAESREARRERREPTIQEGRVRLTQWKQLKAGLCYGIDWDWPLGT